MLSKVLHNCNLHTHLQKIHHESRKVVRKCRFGERPWVKHQESNINLQFSSAALKRLLHVLTPNSSHIHVWSGHFLIIFPCAGPGYFTAFSEKPLSAITALHIFDVSQIKHTWFKWSDYRDIKMCSVGGQYTGNAFAI